MTAEFWRCLACHRHVPLRSTACQCGWSRLGVVDLEWEAPGGTAIDRATPRVPTLQGISRVAWVAIVVLLSYIGLENWNAPPPTETEPPPASTPPPSSMIPAVSAPSTLRVNPSLLLTSSAPIVEERLEYYDVFGSSARELRASAFANAPRVLYEGTWQEAGGTTSWVVTYQATFSVERRCTLRLFQTSVKIRTVMPRWRGGRVEGTRLADQWDRYLQAVSEHERGHAANGLGAAESIHQSVPTLGPAATCEELKQAIDAQAASIIAAYRQADLEYDRRTNRGQAQGTTFPADPPLK